MSLWSTRWADQLSCLLCFVVGLDLDVIIIPSTPTFPRSTFSIWKPPRICWGSHAPKFPFSFHISIVFSLHISFPLHMSPFFGFKFLFHELFFQLLFEFSQKKIIFDLMKLKSRNTWCCWCFWQHIHSREPADHYFWDRLNLLDVHFWHKCRTRPSGKSHSSWNLYILCRQGSGWHCSTPLE